MGHGVPVLLGATKGGLGVAAAPFAGIALATGVVAAAAALAWKAATAAEARSRLDRGGRLRALDELTTAGLLRPEDYGERRAALLREA